MNSFLYLNILIAVCGLSGFLYGSIKYFGKRQPPLFSVMIILAVGCSTLGRIYQFLSILTGHTVTNMFHVGLLGVMGTFSFFFSANYGPIDTLVDDGSPMFRKNRLIGVLGPICVALLYLPIFSSEVGLAVKVSYGIVAIFIGLSLYYNVKHLFISDVEFGIVSCLRPYNALAIFYGILCMLELLTFVYETRVLSMVIEIAIAFILLFIVPIMDRGVKKWTA